jgi:hypothetical protein
VIRLSTIAFALGLLTAWPTTVSANGPPATGYTKEDPEQAKLRRTILKLRSILQKTEGRPFCGDPREIQNLKRLIWRAEFAYANGKRFP